MRAYWSDMRTVLQLYTGQHRKQALTGALLAVLAALSAMGLLALSGWFITATALAGLTLSTAITFNVFAPSAGIRLLALGRTATRYGERVLTHDATLGALADLRARLFLGWSTPGQARALFTHPARLLFRLTTDVDALDGVYLRLGVPLVVGALAVAMVGILLIGLSPWFALFAVLWLLISSWAICTWQVRKSRMASLRQIAALEKHRMQCIDLVSGQSDLIMAHQLHAQTYALHQTQRHLCRAEIRIARIDAIASILHNTSMAVLTTAAMLLLARQFELGTVSLAWGVLTLLACLAVSDPLTQLRLSISQITRTILALQRLGPTIRQMSRNDTVPAPLPRTLPDEASGQTLAFEATAVTLQYEDGLVPVIEDLDLCIDVGEHVALIGPSGSGKSTVLAALASELQPVSGQLQRHLGSTGLTQFPQLLHDSVGENLLIANPDATQEQLWATLETAGLADDLREQHQGLDTILGEGGLGLSVGQQRRLTLARLLLANQPVWLLDEPSDGLDRRLAHDVLHRLFDNTHNRTVVVATHLRREAQHADRLLVLHEGRITNSIARTDPLFETTLLDLRPD